MQCHFPLGVYDGDCPAGHVGGALMQVTTAPQGMPTTPASLAIAVAPPDASAVATSEASGDSPSGRSPASTVGTAPPSATEPAPSGASAASPSPTGAAPSPTAVAAPSEPPPSGEMEELEPLAS